MAEESNGNVEETTEELLEDIYDITIKIKRELDTINDLVRENGDFSTAVSETNRALVKIIDERQIDLSFTEEDESTNSVDNIDKSKNKSNISKKNKSKIS